MQELEKPSQSEQAEQNPSRLSQEVWSPRACVYTDEANGIVAGWKDSNKIPTSERTLQSFASRNGSQTTSFQGTDNKQYQVTEFDTDLIDKSEILLQIKQSDGRPLQSGDAIKEYIAFKEGLENGKLCIELENEPKNASETNRRLPNGDTIEKTAGTIITRTEDGQKVTFQAMDNGKETGRAEYTLAKDREGNEVCILRTKFPDGYSSQTELSAEDFYAIRDAKGQTWKWFGNPENHRFYIQDRVPSIVSKPRF